MESRHYGGLEGEVKDGDVGEETTAIPLPTACELHIRPAVVISPTVSIWAQYPWLRGERQS